MRNKAWFSCGLAAALVVATTAPGARAQGIYLTGGGAPHTAMGGVSTATPVDAIGALYWNPAAISRLGRSEVSIGGAFLFPEFDLSATAPALLGGQSATTRSDSGTGIASSLGVIYQPDESNLTFGIGLSTLGGGGVNFPGDPANPILSGIGALGNVQGPIYSSMTLLQLAPTVATKLGEKLAVGFGPTIAVAVASFDPAYFGGTNDANGDGVGTFPTASHMRPFWGGGFRAGAVYSLSERIDVGFGYTSPQWYETWRAYARDEIGNPLTLNLPVTLPAIYSLGAAIRPNDELLVGADLRFFDYRTTKLFGTPIVDGGIGWESVWSIAVGGQYRLSERLAVQSGYVYNNNPIPSVGTLFNIQAPAITQNTFSCGASYSLTDALAMSLGYSYGFKNTLEGPVREATGAGVKIETSVHALLFGVQVKYGCCAARPACGEGTTLGAAVSPAPSAPSAAH